MSPSGTSRYHRDPQCPTGETVLSVTEEHVQSRRLKPCTICTEEQP